MANNVYQTTDASPIKAPRKVTKQTATVKKGNDLRVKGK